MPDRPPRLTPVFDYYDPALYFVTFNTHLRRKILASSTVHEQFVAYARAGEARGIAVGRYVIMPDHVHLFVRGPVDFVLAQWVRLLKRKLSERILPDPPHWQSGFFDHLIRSGESYGQKWQYVRDNPVRAGMVDDAATWPYQGELVRLEACR